MTLNSEVMLMIWIVCILAACVLAVFVACHNAAEYRQEWDEWERLEDDNRRS